MAGVTPESPASPAGDRLAAAIGDPSGEEHPRAARKVRLVSALIAAWLLLQLVPTLLPFAGNRTHNQLWPFLAYCMYSTPHQEGDRASRFLLFGRTGEGRTVEVAPEALGTWSFGARRTVRPRLQDPVRGAAYARQVMDRYNAAQADPSARIVSLAGVMERRTVMRSGPGAPEREVLFSYGEPPPIPVDRSSRSAAEVPDPGVP